MSLILDGEMTQWINEERTVLVRTWGDLGTLEVAVREDPGAVWGPPVIVVREQA